MRERKVRRLQKSKNPVNSGGFPQRVSPDSFGQNKYLGRMQHGAWHEWVFIMLG